MHTKSVLQHAIALAILFNSGNVYAGERLSVTTVAVEYPRLDLPDGGGRIGVDLDGPYNWNGTLVLRVTAIYPQSPLYGILHPGDYLYGINGFNLRSVADVFAVVSYGQVGSDATLYYMDSQTRYSLKKVTVHTVSSSVFAESSTTFHTAPTASQDDKSFCEQYSTFCTIGGAVVAYETWKLLFGSGSGNQPNSKSTYVPDCHDVPVQDGDGNYRGQTKEICN